MRLPPLAKGRLGLLMVKLWLVDLRQSLIVVKQNFALVPPALLDIFSVLLETILVPNSGIELMHWGGGSTEFRVSLFPNVSSQSRVIFPGGLRSTSNFRISVEVVIGVSLGHFLDVWLHCYFRNGGFLGHFGHAGDVRHACACSLWLVNVSRIWLVNPVPMSVLNGGHWHVVVNTHAVHVWLRIKLFILLVFIEKHFYLFVFPTNPLDRLVPFGSIWLFVNYIVDLNTIEIGLMLTTELLTLLRMLQPGHFFCDSKLIFVHFLVLLSLVHCAIDYWKVSIAVQPLQLLKEFSLLGY